MQSQTTVHILLASYQGARFILEQLDSFANQTHTNWTLTVSDDGSNDGTQDIVLNFKKKVTQTVALVQGPRQGSTANFLSLLKNVQDIQPNDLIAFSDQDDVWMPHKLARAAQYFDELSRNQGNKQLPHLYCTRTQLVDEDLKMIGMGKYPRKPLNFCNALLENVAAGNTIVFTPALQKLLLQINPVDSIWHDWTTYILATACGGTVHFDDQPSLLYRQHGGNVFGSNFGVKASLHRLQELGSGTYRRWNEANIRALSAIKHEISASSAHTIDMFIQMREHPNPWARLNKTIESGISRQKCSAQAAIMVGVLFKLV